MTDQEFQRLVTGYLEGAIDEGNLHALNRELSGSSERVRQFNDIRLLAGLIHEHGRSVLEPEASSTEAESEYRTLPAASGQSGEPSPRLARWKWLEHASLAALLLICAGLGVLLWQRHDGEQELGNSVARLHAVSDDAVFSDEHVLPRQVDRLLEKGWVHLEHGTVRIRFHSGASVELNGPATFGLDSSMRAWLEFGRASVHAPESARDFVVATDSMEVVDLGTRFEIDVDRESRESNVAVTEGLVDLHLGSRGAPRRIQPLQAGWQAQVDGSGDIVRLEAQSDDKPADDPGSRTPLLAHWRFDSHGDETTVTDSTQHALHGTFIDGSDGGLVPGVTDKALDLGRRGCVDLSEHAARFAQADSFTIASWVRDPGDRIAIVFSLSDGTDSHRVQFHLNRRHVVFGWQNGLHYDAVSGRVSDWEPGRWYHVAVAVRDGMVWLYRDGQRIGSSAVGSKLGTPILSLSGVQNPSHAFLGRLPDGGPGAKVTPQWFGGALDDVQVYTIALSAKSIEYLYQNPGKPWRPHDIPVDR